MMTEHDAKTKWCPYFVDYSSTGSGTGGKCWASACMMWRWNIDYDRMIEEGQGGDIVIRLKRKRDEPRLGHCGMATSPVLP
jgi:hypothetical protein